MRPMLAATLKSPEALHYPLLGSPKYDGIRALVLDGVVVSRSLKPIPNDVVQARYGRPELEGFDGELIVGPPGASDVYRRTMAEVMSFEGKDGADFYVFDDCSTDQVFHHRLALAAKRAKKLRLGVGKGRVHVVHHFDIDHADKLLEVEAAIVDQGYEGLMLRDPLGPYKHGRSTEKEGWLLKLKRFEDSEATIIGFEELMINKNEAKLNELGYQERSSKKEGLVPSGHLGAFVVRDLVSKVEFKLGSGFTLNERELFWKVRRVLRGKVVTYKFMRYGVKDKPRLPIYKGFRDQIDLATLE